MLAGCQFLRQNCWLFSGTVLSESGQRNEFNCTLSGRPTVDEETACYDMNSYLTRRDCRMRVRLLLEEYFSKMKKFVLFLN